MPVARHPLYDLYRLAALILAVEPKVDPAVVAAGRCYLEEGRQRLEELEHDRDALVERYAGAVPEALEKLTTPRSATESIKCSGRGFLHIRVFVLK